MLLVRLVWHSEPTIAPKHCRAKTNCSRWHLLGIRARRCQRCQPSLSSAVLSTQRHLLWLRLAALTLWTAALSFCLSDGARAQAVDWVRAGLNTNQPLWGIRGGLLWAVPPGGFGLPTGPRGLIRIGYPIATNSGCELVNFIAVEPIVHGVRGFSELEPSALDHTSGKRMWAVGETNLISAASEPVLTAGRLSQPSPGVEQLDVIVRVEPFDNGARVRLVVSQRSDAPNEIQLAVHAEPGSAPLDYCILTATMGNLARARLLWLKDEVVSSLVLYPKFKGEGFTPHRIYPLDRLARSPTADVLVGVTTDEDDPASVYPFPGRRLWHYGGSKVTQYWKKLRGTAHDDLHVAVNARYTYWQSRQPIPGGVAFENFELRERFYEGQVFTFGITRKTPAQLGLGGPL